MKNGDMNSFMADLFTGSIGSLIAKKILPKGSEAARTLNLTYDQYKNICSERTAISPVQWGFFIKTLKQLDDHEYQWVVKKLLGG